MTQNKKLEKFAKLVSDKPSNFLAKLEQYNSNKKWLDYSSKVAINVLEILKEKNWSQKDLAEKMNVSAQQINKIIKGQQNLTFETIAKLEDALGFTLIEIPNFISLNEIVTNSTTQIKAYDNFTQEKISIAKPFSNEFIKKEGGHMTIVYNSSKQINYKKAV
jgi:transcriptional regulator with XRE-family HTH domain